MLHAEDQILKREIELSFRNKPSKINLITLCLKCLWKAIKRVLMSLGTRGQVPLFPSQLQNREARFDNAHSGTLGT